MKKIILYIPIFLLVVIKSYSQELNAVPWSTTPNPPKTNSVIPGGHLKSTSSSAVTLDDVPNYRWSYGCAPTAAAMLIGYYDRKGWDCLYNGQKWSGLPPLNDSELKSVETVSYQLVNNPLSASKNGIDGRNKDGHVDDFWVDLSHGGLSKCKYKGVDPDGWYSGDPPHSFDYLDGICMADFLGTSQDYFNNCDGNTRFITKRETDFAGKGVYGWKDGTKKYDDNVVTSIVNPTTGIARDFSYGLGLYFQECGYSVNNSYNMVIDSKCDTTEYTGFTFSDFKNQINNGRPVIVHVQTSGGSGHTTIGYGYDEGAGGTDSIVKIYDAWGGAHDVNWGGDFTVNGTWTMREFTIVEPDPNSKEDGTCVENEYWYPTGKEDVLTITSERTFSISLDESYTVSSEYGDSDPYQGIKKWKCKLEIYSDEGAYTVDSIVLCDCDICDSTDCYSLQSTTPHYYKGEATFHIPASLPTKNWNWNSNCNIDATIVVSVEDGQGYMKYDRIHGEIQYPIKTKRIISGPIYKDNTIIKAHSITASNIIDSSAVSYFATNSIKLTEGFHVSSHNSAFGAFLVSEFCSNSSLKSTKHAIEKENKEKDFSKSKNNLEKVTIFPNPSSDGRFNVLLENINIEKVKINIFNSSGILALSKIINGRKKINIDISGFTRGVYYVEIRSKQNIFNKKLIYK